MLYQSRLLALQALLQLGVVLFQPADPLLRLRAFLAALGGGSDVGKLIMLGLVAAVLLALTVQGILWRTRQETA